MTEDFISEYRFLDTEAERQELVADIREVRQAVSNLTHSIPETLWYEPRYHGWTLASTLAHLHFVDNLGLFVVKMGMVGLKFPLGAKKWDRINDFTTGVLFKKRVVKTTLRGIERNERRLADFVTAVPMNKFTARVFDPPSNSYLTIERAMQKWFLHHWQEHLAIMRQVEGITSGSESAGVDPQS